MNTHSQPRAYRKAITSHGWLYLGGEAREITVKNISLSGFLVGLNNNIGADNQRTLKNLSAAKSIDFYFPQLQLSGVANIVRVDTELEDQILLAMEFNELVYTDDQPIYNRKSYRKEVALPGRILLAGEYHEFVSVNMSLGGIMIRVPENLTVEPDIITKFEFEHLNLKGLAKIAWCATLEESETLVGLEYAKQQESGNTNTESKLH